MNTDMAGVYVHVPFCAQRCGYCDFNVLTGAGDELRARYVAALHAEVDRTAAAGPAGVAPPGADPGAGWPAFGSVHVGGGTPTQLPAADLAGVIGHIRDALPLHRDAEITVEANPEDVDAAYLSVLVEAGLTRLSIGAQSFQPHVLAFLDRGHHPDRARGAVAAARDAGVAQVSLDLMYGAPCESTDDWTATLATAVAVGTDHLSCYALTVETNTPYAADIRRGACAGPDDDEQAERMAVAEEQLGAAGFSRYEISNWARPGARSVHNLTYWRGGDWLGLGAGAHGHWRGTGAGARARRWWNVRPTGRYADAALAGMATAGGAELLDEEARRTERLMMGLRLTEGVARADVGPLDEPQARRLVAAGLLTDDGRRLALTPAGRPLAGDVILRLLPRTPTGEGRVA